MARTKYRGVKQSNVVGFHHIGRMLAARAATLQKPYSARTGKPVMRAVLAKTKRRLAGTFVKTRRKRVFHKARKVDKHTSVSSYRVVNRLPFSARGALKQVGKRLDYEQGSDTMSGSTGQQKIMTKMILGGADLFKLVTKYSGGALTDAQKTQIVWLRWHKTKMELTNTTNASTRFQIYTITPRFDMDSTATTKNPLSDWSSGLTDEGGVNALSARWHTSPFQSVSFVRQWKVHKVTNFTLDPGESHIHYVRLNLNKRIDPYRLLRGGQTAALESSNTNMKGFTHYVMVVANGVPCVVETGNAVTTTACGCVMAYSSEACVQAVTDNSVVTTFQTTALFPEGAANTVEIIDVESGLKEPETDVMQD